MALLSRVEPSSDPDIARFLWHWLAKREDRPYEDVRRSYPEIQAGFRGLRRTLICRICAEHGVPVPKEDMPKSQLLPIVEAMWDQGRFPRPRSLEDEATDRLIARLPKVVQDMIAKEKAKEADGGQAFNDFIEKQGYVPPSPAPENRRSRGPGPERKALIQQGIAAGIKNAATLPSVKLRAQLAALPPTAA